MKTSIPSDVWEKKKSLIARLYKDEEWPLKQVIKQIRTEDFNPSETQLRSRLKKWRVTKPSRQTRKKTQDGPRDTTVEDDDGPGDTSPVESKNASIPPPQPQTPQLQQKDMPANPEWYATNGWFPPQQRQQQDVIQPPAMAPSLSLHGRDATISSAWAAPSSEPQSQQSLHPRDNSAHIPNTMMQSFSMVHPTPISYELHQPAPPSSNVTTSMVAPSYTNPAYVVSTETCLPTPAPTVGVQWPSGANHIEPDIANSGLPMLSTWFSAPFEAVNHQPPPGTYYTHKAVHPSMAHYGQMVQPMPTHTINQAYSPSPSMGDAFQSGAFDDSGLIKPWRRAIASHYSPEAAAGHARVDRQGRQRKSITEPKRKESSPSGVDMTAHQQQMQSMQTHMQSQFLASGQHPMMPQDMFAYASHEQLMERPSGH